MKNFHCIILLMLYLMYGPTYGQKMFWSDMTEADKQDALKIGEKFKTLYLQSDFEAISNLLSSNEIFIGHGIWLNNKKIVNELKKDLKKVKFSDSKTNGYIFDDFLENHDASNLIQRTFEAFDNHSVLVTLAVQANASDDVILVIRKTRTNAWEITGIVGIISPDSFSPSVSDEDFRMEKISGPDIHIPIPRAFSEPDLIQNQTLFFFEGSSGRDAVFQVMSDQLNAKIYYYTYKFVEHNNQQFKMSGLVVRYVPHGILYEYEVIDPEGIINKGITVGLKKGAQVILVQFYSFVNVYEKMKDEVQYALSNITI